MTLIKSISGIRGTIGGTPEEGLNPLAIVKFVAAYATFIRKNTKITTNKIVVGRDARISGPMVKQVVLGTLTGMGFDVVDIDLATTPTTELAVTMEGACGGIILTASHNPKQWNALKLLNEKGEFLNAAEGAEVLALAEKEDFQFADVDHLGKVITDTSYIQKHIDAVLKLALGVEQIVELNCEPTGHFAHNPEPLPENLTAISELIKKERADVGFVVDPDVDRLAIVCENGEMFVEEYTLVAVADYVLSHTPGNTVSNLSSSRALRDVTRRYAGCEYNASAVGEVNVVAKMKATHAIIGGEGNGGVIYPASHYGRDALVGIALFLSHLAKKNMRVSELRSTYPIYYISKQKVQLTPEINVDAILSKVKEQFATYDITDIDGVKIDFPDKWVHLRKSNTEPIIRIYSEAHTMQEAEELGGNLIQIIHEMCK